MYLTLGLQGCKQFIMALMLNRCFANFILRRCIFKVKRNEKLGRDTHWVIWNLNHVVRRIFRRKREIGSSIRLISVTKKRNSEILKKKQRRQVSVYYVFLYLPYVTDSVFVSLTTELFSCASTPSPHKHTQPSSLHVMWRADPCQSYISSPIARHDRRTHLDLKYHLPSYVFYLRYFFIIIPTQESGALESNRRKSTGGILKRINNKRWDEEEGTPGHKQNKQPNSKMPDPKFHEKQELYNRREKRAEMVGILK